MIVRPRMPSSVTAQQPAEPDEEDEASASDEREPFGCVYVEKWTVAIGASFSTKRTAKCAEGQKCYQVQPPDPTLVAAGGMSASETTTYEEMRDFTGLCADQELPPTCEDVTPVNECEECIFSSSCGAYVRCAENPDCTSIAACVGACGSDEQCEKTCIDAGEPEARKTFGKLARVVRECRCQFSTEE